MSKNLLNTVKLVRPNSSVFDLTNDHKTTCNMGNLVPVYWDECIPGDRWKMSQQALVRMAPLIAPMMHRVKVYFHCFFVPYRILWPNWENYITNKKIGSPAALPVVPYATVNDLPVGVDRLSNYLGIPFGADTSIKFTLFAHAAYNKIWNDWYRDQDLQNEVYAELTDGSNTNGELFELKNRAWMSDYFTSCRPTPQKGESVDVPLGDVVLKDPWYTGQTDLPQMVNTVGLFNTGAIANDNAGGNDHISVAAGGTYAYDPKGTLSVQPTLITELRRAFKLQEFLERENVGGTRYTEQNYSMFGVHSSDKRLQRPEYITGSSTQIQISEVLQTSSSDEVTPQGNMAGHGIGVVDGYDGHYFCEEHGIIMCLMSIMPETAYYQGIPKKLTKFSDRYQHFWPQFESIGEQEVLNKELYALSPTGLDQVFGYNPRYTEYKVAFNRVSGNMANSLLTWHMARQFSSNPGLNGPFIASDPTVRIFADTEELDDHMIVHVLNRVKARRLMSKYSTPHI